MMLPGLGVIGFIVETARLGAVVPRRRSVSFP